MGRDMRSLIIASGYAGSSGQNFLNHVAGAASGLDMQSWILDSITEDATDFQAYNVHTYNDNDQFYVDFTFNSRNYGKFPYIRRPAAEYSVNVTAPDPPETGLNVEIASVSYPSVIYTAGNRVYARLKAFTNTTSRGTVSGLAVSYNYFHDLNNEPWQGLSGYDPAVYPYTMDDQLWRIEIGYVYSPPSQTTHDITFELWYPADPGAFNPTRQIGSGTRTARVNDIMAYTSEYWRWWSDSSHTTALLDYNGNSITGPTAILWAGPNTSGGGTVYPQWATGPSGPWTDYPSNNAGVAWDDPRF